MKNFCSLFVFALLLSGCTSSRYALNDQGKDKKFLTEFIEQKAGEGIISEKPLIVIDGEPYRYHQELKENPLSLSKADIDEMLVLEHQTGIQIYGEPAKFGTVVIATKAAAKKEKLENKPKTLFLLDDKEISEAELKMMSADAIETITVINNKEEIKAYTAKDFDQVLLIKLKQN